jgi:hypothetical protein
MKFQSQVIASASGSVGGCTYSRNRFGQYMRRRAMPVNPLTVFQTAVRQQFAVLAARWKDVLTDAEREAWTTYGVNTPVLDSLGFPIILTGLNWYIACNTARLLNPLVALNIVDTAPGIFGKDTFSQVSVTASEATQIVSVAYVNTDGWAGEVGGALAMYSSRPFSPSVNFFKGPYRFGKYELGAVAPPASPDTFASPFVLTAGQNMGFRVLSVRADGRISTPQTGVITVGA